MIGLGKVYDHWMVDLRATNRKLELRDHAHGAQLGRVPPERARRLFARSGRNVKRAILMARGGLSATEAARRLSASGGFLRAALEKL
jgi:N-acetylmuramic acid 6-phosphate etherase